MIILFWKFQEFTNFQESPVAKLEILAGDRSPQFMKPHYEVALPEDSLIDYR